MNREVGFANSFSGFTDYILSFEGVDDVVWMIVGIFIFVGTWVSIYPQYHVIVVERSSFGLDPNTFFVMLFAQYLLVANVFCLRTGDFVGVLQYPFSVWLSRWLTFINAFANWISYLPVVFMHWQFFDIEPRARRDADKIRQELWLTEVLLVLNPIGAVIITALYFAIGAAYGFDGDEVLLLGRIYGIIAAVLWAAQYLPQMWTTCRLKSAGNMSLLVLAIQAPGGLINSLFMWIGQGDDWTTWISSLAAAIQQFFLLGIGMYYRWREKKLKVGSEEESVPSGENLPERTATEGTDDTPADPEDPKSEHSESE
jgi:uncharacterized protein with PQ loop repeat